VQSKVRIVCWDYQKRFVEPNAKFSTACLFELLILLQMGQSDTPGLDKLRKSQKYSSKILPRIRRGLMFQNDIFALDKPGGDTEL